MGGRGFVHSMKESTGGLRNGKQLRGDFFQPTHIAKLVANERRSADVRQAMNI